MEHIRNFSIIAHIDHGKSTLSDRLLELTGTIEKRKMQEQVLDSMDLERERGITIKMQPVRMQYAHEGDTYTLNLIDTPGHIDFSYEVSRALAACEGAVLLVDATQGVQAQTLSHFHVAQKLQLPLIPVLNKIDAPHADVDRVMAELEELGFAKDDIYCVSAKTGEGVEELLEAIIQKIPPPKSENAEARALIYDSEYDDHGGIVAYVRVVDGTFRAADKLFFIGTEALGEVKEIGVLAPKRTKCKTLSAGEIGYIVTGIKVPKAVDIGDTITSRSAKGVARPLPGYREPSPVVWASFFPEDQGEFADLGLALEKLHLNDSSLSFTEFSTAHLGRGYQCGFLGTLHLEITAERLRREFGLQFIVTAPSVSYLVYRKGQTEECSSPHLYPKKGEADMVEEPIIAFEIILPEAQLSQVFKIQDVFEMQIESTDLFGTGRMLIKGKMPLRAFVKDFFETLHQLTSGFASVNYQLSGHKKAELERMDVVVAGDQVEALSRVVRPSVLMREARELASRIKDTLPREQFEIRVQVIAAGRIVAAEKIPAMKKDVTGHLYGGDRTRKMKLWAKQKKGKERLKAQGKVHIPTETFLKLLKK